MMLKDIEFANSIYFDYGKYSETSLTSRRFKHSEILPLIKSLNKHLFNVESAGHSVEGREIFTISAGTGKIKILCWSQMHGDESTATMALFDIMKFLSAKDSYDEIRKSLLTHLTLSFIPMLNPDGAENFSRRNKSGIDINRDAVRQISPEAVILNQQFFKFRPGFGFNLHDQDPLYTAGDCFKSAAISFLAPPSDREKTIDHTRLNAMKVISRLYRILSVFIPGHIGKYPDDFEPRAFGDNLQKSGSSTILVESGGWLDDIEKQFLRKINFILLLSAFKSIAEESYKKESADTYENIPMNENYLFDVLLKNLIFRSSGKEYIIDIGINYIEKTCNDGRNFYYESVISDIGDLSIYYGNKEIDLSGYLATPGKTSLSSYENITSINDQTVIELLSKGYTNIKINAVPDDYEYSPIPLNLILSGKYLDKDDITIDDPANIVISRDGEVKFVVINGQIILPQNPREDFRNALIL